MIANIEKVVATTFTLPDERGAEPKRAQLVTNTGLGESVRRRLLDQGYAVQVLDHESLRDSSALGVDADIVVIDRSGASLSNLDTMARLRLERIKVPVVFVSSPASRANYAADVVRGPDVLAALQSALRVAEAFGAPSNACAAEEPVICGKLDLRPESGRAYWNGVDVDLTTGEYRIVELLASHPDRHFTYRAIYDRLRHENFIAGDGPSGYWCNVRSAIKRIRKKFRALDPEFDQIENYHAFGYRWHKHD